VVEAVRLDLAGFRSGSAIIDIVRPPQPDPASGPDDTLLSDSLNALEDGIARLRSGSPLPVYFTPQVITGLRELAGGINPSNLTRTSFDRSNGHQFVMDGVFREQLRMVSARAPEAGATVVGRRLTERQHAGQQVRESPTPRCSPDPSGTATIARGGMVAPTWSSLRDSYIACRPADTISVLADGWLDRSGYAVSLTGLGL